MKDEDKLIPTVQETELATAKQYFYQYFGQPERVSKVFEGTFLYRIEQMEDLNNQITDKLKMYQNAGFLITVKVKLKNKKIFEFNTWKSFQEHRWVDSCATESITIKWQFNAILPNNPTPHNHVVSLTLTNGMKPEELMKLIFSGSLEDEKNLDIAPYPIFTSIVFINRILADEILEIISKWVDNINEENIEENPLKKFLRKHRQMVAISTEYLITFFLMFSSSFSFLKASGTVSVKTLGELPLEKANFFLAYFFIVIGIFFIANRVAKMIAQVVFSSLSSFRAKSFFALSEKDKKVRNLLKDNQKSSIIKLLSSFAAIVLSSFVGLLIERLLTIFF